jgi:putative ABC transport system ATP-binding protein
MKILVDLNIKEGITMIMVTHDVVLKAFANRVVRMVDGKIHKIINMPGDRRREVIN